MNKSILSLNIDDFNKYLINKYPEIKTLFLSRKTNKARKYNIEILTYVEALNKDF